METPGDVCQFTGDLDYSALYMCVSDPSPGRLRGVSGTCRKVGSETRGIVTGDGPKYGSTAHGDAKYGWRRKVVAGVAYELGSC
jgi:hypothetical protein